MTGRRKMRIAAIALLLPALSCGIYSFSGKSLPSHLKTVEIPLFASQALEPGVAEDITTELSNQILSGQDLRPVARGGDALLSGIVLSYAHDEYQYDIKGERTVDVKQYMVKMTVAVTFEDLRKNQPLYKGVITAQGIYAFGSEKETDGRKRAITDAVRQILQNSVQSW